MHVVVSSHSQRECTLELVVHHRIVQRATANDGNIEAVIWENLRPDLTPSRCEDNGAAKKRVLAYANSTDHPRLEAIAVSHNRDRD
jgi:hypothetical protein